MFASARISTTPLLRVPAVAAQTLTTTNSPSKEEEKTKWPQRTPLGEYYAAIMRNSLPYPFAHKPKEAPSSKHSSAQDHEARPSKQEQEQEQEQVDSHSETAPSPSRTRQQAQERARIVFGSRLLGPAEQANRLQMKQEKSTLVAGVLVPPQPEEPDNCCMSGCVNCVWDRYREDMEEWTDRKNEAQTRLAAGAVGGDVAEADTAHANGNKSERTDWQVSTTSVNNNVAKNMWDDEVYQGVPVGIREFMKQEKRLKEKHTREGTQGG